eukprot:TRINITY_DN4879_c0_g1_i11.p1 TRINITY_DN4879_c0_g1~~TRINITY_DN4879_c0_g1_i11.p1  ORF type:complete len:387 (-),score=19.10 TRINITY_DN4879_c0_g1_i11:826-1986(-)
MPLKISFAGFIIAVSLMTVAGSMLFLWTLFQILNVQRSYAFYVALIIGADCALVLVIVRLFPLFLSRVLYCLLSAYWGFLFYLFLCSLLFLTINAFHKLSQTWSLFILFVPSVLMFVCGFYNSFTLAVRRLSFKLPVAKRNLSIAHISDLHLGPVYGKRHVARVVNEIKRFNPDFVMITGDLFDGSMLLSPDVLSPFNELEADIYFALGNHDDVFLGLEEVKRVLRGSKIILLKDEAVINRNVNIIGISYRVTADFLVDKLKKINATNDTLNILLYHAPALLANKFEEYNIHLHLGGHTHGGQLFPLYSDTLSPFKYVKGLRKSDSGNAYVHISEGAGTAGPRIRMFSRSSITLLNINPCLMCDHMNVLDRQLFVLLNLLFEECGD